MLFVIYVANVFESVYRAGPFVVIITRVEWASDCRMNPSPLAGVDPNSPMCYHDLRTFCRQITQTNPELVSLSEWTPCEKVCLREFIMCPLILAAL